ncbi:MAG TPA: DMT family transporter [Candidatus Limnocylindria bacterium]|nr:DMT family transporter [Candidatus Limnocylindria bacterium]
MAAVLLACVSAALFGAMAVAIRFALLRADDPELGALATSTLALALTGVIGLSSAPGDLHPGDLWPFLLAGAIAPGSSQILFMRAVREAGAARTAVLMGAAPLFSVAIALVVLGEPVRAPLLVGAALIVVGGIALAGERVRPAEFSRVGFAFALAATVLFAVRDNLLRWLAEDTAARALVTAPVSLLAGAGTIAVYLLISRRGEWAGGYGRAVRVFLPAGVLFGFSYSALFEAYYRGRVSVVAPLVATESLWGVLFSGLLLRRSELVGRRLVMGALLIVAGGALIGGWR